MSAPRWSSARTCDRLSRLRVLLGGLTPERTSDPPSFRPVDPTPPYGGDTPGSPKFPMFSLPTCHALETPAKSLDACLCTRPSFRLPQILLRRPSLVPVTRLIRFGEVSPPYGPWNALCTLTLCRSALSSFIMPTLDTGSWLNLTRRGLTPRKRTPSFAWRTIS